MKSRYSFWGRVGLLLSLCVSIFQPQSSVSALTTLTVTPITWNVIGLDSNNVNVGPNHFPVGVRVCNTGSEAATDVTATFNWDTSNTFINIRSGTLSTINKDNVDALATLAGGNTCADVYFEVEVTRNSSAYDTTRDYYISVSGTNVTGGTVNTPVRQLYVEHLVSQNRNATTNVEFGPDGGPLTSLAAGGTMNLMVGNTYDIKLTGFTATQGYEQLETFLNIPNVIFQTLDVTATHTANAGTDPSAATKLYANGCNWENDQSDPDYRSCMSTGKYGGNITITYTVKILQVPASPLVNPVPLSSLIYDFSGSSYHYNADYSVSTRYANIINASIEKSFSPKTITPGSNSTLTFTINNPGTSSISSVNFTDDLPTNVNLANANVTYSGCGSPSPTSGSLVDPLSFTNITVAGNSTCTITVTVTSSTNGTYPNTTSTLKIGSTSTGDSASDTLVVSSAPAPPNSCTTRTTMATWNFENYSALAGNTLTAGDSGPFDASSDILINTPTGTYISQGLSESAIIDRDLAVPTNWTIPSTGNTTTVWGIRNAWPSAAPADITNPTSPFFQFQVNTDGLYGGVGITLDYNLMTSGGWSNSGPWYILFSTNGTTWSNLSPSTPPVGIDGTWDKGSWVPTSDVDTINADSTSTSSTVYFRLYFVGANSSQIDEAHAYIDNVVISGCPTPPPPTVSKSFGTDPVSVGSNSTLTFTISNTTSGNSALTGVNFTDVLPGGLLIASTPNLTNTCGGTATAAANTSTISLASGTLAAGATCTISVSVRGVTAGSYTNTSTNISSTESGANTSTTPNVGFAQDTIVVILPPVIQKSFTANPIFTGNTTTLLFSINNPNSSTTLTGVSFTDTLPTGLDVTSGSSAQCGGTLTLTNNAPAADTVVLSGGSLAGGATCSFSVTVTGTTAGLKTNTVTVSSTNGGTGNTDTADVVVKAQTPAISTLKSVSTSNLGPWSPSLTVTLPGSVYYRFIVENIGDVALSNVNISDPNVNTSTCTWTDGDGTTISTSGANFSLPVADASDNQIATCIVGPITALAGTNPNTVTADDNNPGTANTSDTSSATYTGIQSNLTVSKTDNDADDTVLPGGSFTWTINVTNNGTATANFANTQVIMSDALPGADSYYTIGSINETNGGTPPTGTIDCAIVAGPTLSCVANGPVTLPAGASFSVTFTVTPTSVGTLANTAIVDPNNVVAESNENISDNQSTNTITVQGIDISLTKDVSDDTPDVGSNVTFTLTLSNTGLASATNIIVTDIVPSGYTYVTASINSNTGATGATITPDDTNPTTTGLTWSTNQLDIGESVTLTYQATVLASGVYDNYAQVTAHDQTDNDSTPNNGQQTPDEDDDDTQTVTPTAVINVSLDKQVSDSTPDAGANVTFTLVIANAGPSTATNINVTDVVPSGYAYVGSSITGGDANNDANPATTGLTWTINSLASGASVNLTYQATVLASGTYNNYAEITSHTQTDSNSTPGNGSTNEDDDDTETVTPNAVAVAPSISKNYSPDSIAVGGTSTLTFTITNPNASTALTGVAFSDTFPVGTQVAATPNQTNTCGGTFTTTAGSGTVSLTGGSIVGGGSCTLSVDVTATTSGTKNNTSGNVSSTNGGTGNTASDSLTVNPRVDISLTKDVSDDTPDVGSNVTFTLTLTNGGPDSATNIVVTDVVPSGYTYVAASINSNAGGTGATITPNDTNPASSGLTWSVNQLDSGESVTLSYQATVLASGTYDNYAQVTAHTQTDNDSTPNNGQQTPDEDDDDTQTVTPNAIVDISLTKDVNDDTPNVSDVVTFTLTLSNAGPSTATNVEVQDAIPSGYLYVAASIDSNAGATGATITETEGSGVLIWDVDALDSGENVTLTYQATVLASGFYDNYVQVTAHDQTDSDSTPNNGQQTPDEDDDDLQTVTPNPVADLSITKTDGVTNVTTGGSTTYTIVITNAGPSSADNAIFTDPSATGLSATSVTCGSASGGAICPTVGNTTVALMQGSGIIIPTFPSGGSVTFTVIANVTANSGTVTNVANINPPSGTTDTNLTNNSSSDTDTVDPILAPALNITKSGTLDMAVIAPNSQANAGDVINYNISVQNTGNQDLTGVSVSDPLLSNLDCDSVTAGNQTTGLSITIGNSLSCTGSYTLTQTDLDNNGGGDGDIDNTATADSNETGPDTDTEEVVIPLDPSIQVDKNLVSTTFNNPNELRITYTINVQNTGNVALTNVQITDDLVAAFPGSVSFSVFTHFSSGSTALTINNAFDGDNDQNLLAGTDTLAVGASGQITLIVDVDTGGDEDQYINTAVGTGTPPTGPAVTDDGSTGTPSFVDPAIAKAANPTLASVGEVVTFTITVTNEGNLPAPDVVVVDPLPAMFDVTNVTVTGGPAGTVTTVNPPIGGTAPFTVTVEIGGPPGIGNNPLGVTDVVVIQITTVVNSLGNPPITNSATLTTTAQTDNLFNNAATIPITILSPADGGAVPVLPDTGFAPNIITDLPVQPDDLAYNATDVILEIPNLGLKMPIVGVPLTKNGWDVTWLGKQAGWLEGSAFPSWNGNSVLTGHVTLSNGLVGPFAKLSTLKYGDQIIVHANGQKFIFELRSNTTVSPDNKRYFKHEELPWLTLITCKEYDEKNDTYKKRVVVRAVLVEVTE